MSPLQLVSTSCTASRTVKASLVSVLRCHPLPFARGVIAHVLFDKQQLDQLKSELLCSICKECGDVHQRVMDGLLQSKAFFKEVWSVEQMAVLQCVLSSKAIYCRFLRFGTVMSET
eukprot:m.122472 g.122472  ORF g.122472 m.122472 type:complete len:116 (+) comp37784_c0_seq12:146-493(+)